ncbi:MAG: aminopeptidase P family N-terminal domain-containing protein, partial [Ignavibacteria bacterium]|nr:aminopeptidase P family N-terminal domain-containing protein [Ignavibacteria bacterium]
MHRRHFLKTTATGAIAPFILSSSLAQEKEQKNPRIAELRNRIKPITKEERLQRQDNARKLMGDHFIDALFCEGGTSLEYFTGVKWGRSERVFGMILPKNGDTVYIAPKFEEGRALEQVGDAKLFT